ncbi:MAG: hypothetical protein ACRKFN_09445 [Desulfitobacterium sp.]
MSKNKRKRHNGKYIIIVAAIIALNTMGMTYAHWDNQLKIQTSLQTGNMDPAFCGENYWINIVGNGSEQGNQPSWDDSEKGINESALSNLDISFDEKRQTMNITGTLEDGYKAFIHYAVVNDGTIPIKYAKDKGSDDQVKKLMMGDNFKVKVQQQDKVLEPQEKPLTNNGNVNHKLEIQIPNQLESKGYAKKSEQLTETGQTHVELGTYSFEIGLPFKQWTEDQSSGGYGDED